MKIYQWALVGLWFCACQALFPQDSESREVKLLSGLWNFRADNSSTRNAGFKDEWFKKPLKKSGSVIDMPVPASFNDITQDVKLRDFVGWVWYDREFFVPKSWNDEDRLRVVIRFESCHYTCEVWVNSEKVATHNGGHLPFETEVTTVLKYGQKNRVTVAANNTLSPTTLPPGTIEYMNNTRKYPPGYFVQNLQMDFFNYAGIHRHVKLYTTPTVYLLDLTVFTDFEKTTGLMEFRTSVAAMDSSNTKDSRNEIRESRIDIDEDIVMVYTLFDADGKQVANTEGLNLFKGTMNVSNVQLWWPVDMGEEPAYMYELQVTVSSGKSNITDIYRQNVGFRTIDVDEKNFMINGKPFYFKGFGMHEDADIRGKGLDLPIITKDFNLLKWMGGNSFRTSHYPYADEIMDFADRSGIVVIDECPGVGIWEDNMEEVNLAHHKIVMKEVVNRDKNHPSVVMWSVANEPKSQLPEAEPYFKAIIQYTRGLDETRPVTFVGNQSPYDDKALQFVDVICWNVYYAWYTDPGHLELISRQLEYDMRLRYDLFEKPVMLTEYGAGSIIGLHMVQFVDVVCYNHYYAWYHDYGHIELIAYQLERDLNTWYRIHEKPVMLSEYGADSVIGIHLNPSMMFSEEYQVETIKQYFPVFDKLKKEFLVGEMIWNFADFMTVQDTHRVVGNRKGVFTRTRQPKWAAHVLRERYRNLSSRPTEGGRDSISEVPDPVMYNLITSK